MKNTQEPTFWQLFGLSLGLSLLCTGLAVYWQRKRKREALF